jgi:hypothetical protein
MPLTLPPGRRMAVALTFDFDAHSNWMGSLGRTSLSSWYLDDWPAVEYVAGVSPLGRHNDMIDRWKTVFKFAYTRVPGVVYTLTMHPQTIGRSHHLLGLEQLLDEMAGHSDIWYATLSELADAWHD